MIVIVGAIAELERSLIIERVRAGMRRAKLEGRHIGRKPLNVDRQAVYPAPPLDSATLVTVAGFSVHIDVAPVPQPLVMTTLGAEVYPEPAVVIVIAVTRRFETVALAVAPVPPPPEIVTVGVPV